MTAPARRAAAQHRAADDRSGRADQRPSAAWCSGREALGTQAASSAPAPTGDWVDGDSQEDAYIAAPGADRPPAQQAVLALQRISGGTQRSVGAFVQDIFTPMPTARRSRSARASISWRNYDGHNLETTVADRRCRRANNRPSLPDRDDTVVSPRVAALYHVTDRVSVWGDIGSGFRAPTLNELYRQFRVGTVLHARQRSARPRAAGRRRSGRQHRADAQPDDAHDLVRQPRQEPGRRT